MKRKGNPQKILSLRVFGILNTVTKKVTKVSLDREELEFEIELDNIQGNLLLCDFTVKVQFPI